MPAFLSLTRESVFPAHVREQDDVTDVGRVGQQHDETVDTDAAAASRWHAVFQRADVIGIVIPVSYTHLDVYKRQLGTP